MNFWDSSALVPLIVEQASTSKAEEVYRCESHGVLVWWGSFTECVSAIARLERLDQLDNHECEQALRALSQLSKNWHEILPSDMVREKANRILRLHPLRAGDAFQLASAIVASEDQMSKLGFVTYDERLAIAARKEGFTVQEKLI